MNLQPSDDQLAVAATANDFLINELPMSRVRELADDAAGAAIDDQTWGRCAELGWLGLSLPEGAGGVGLGLPEEVMLFRELGRHLTPGPFLPSTLAAHVAAVAGADALASAIASGKRRVGIAVDDLAVNVRTGDLLLVIDANSGELFELHSIQQVAGIDPGSRFARVAKGASVARVEDAHVLDRARVLAAAEQLGIIEAVRDISAEYARTRIQFGQPIGAFQAVKHRCADMAIAAYAAIGEVFQAALLVDDRTPDAAFHAATAYLLTAQLARASTAANIQNHGGIGFTWEHGAHLFLKRAFLLEHLLGGPRRTCDAVMTPARHEFS
ncbi:acyl-CoA dehydrogenase family protein [Mycobacterium sp.]|uniref:acyl-CoA dehydrogenase family protein n=1 Tax=Mycobacterium sp. TaxID=1785 RepID=UPI0033423EFF|nr:hypothetical protein [Mycobacterium sp.]